MLKSIADSARAAATALKSLATAKLPKGLLVTPKGGAAGANATPTVTVAQPTVTVAQPTVATPPVPPTPIIPGAQASGGAGGNSWGQLAKVALAFAGVGSLIGLLKSMISGFKEMISSVRSFAQATKNTASLTGLSLRQIKTWEALGAKVGMKAEDVQNILGGLTENSTKLRYEGGNLKFYSLAGMSTNADPDTQLRQFMTNTASLPMADANYIGKQLGISPEMIAAMRQYGDGLDAMAKEVENTIKEQEKLVAVNESANKMGFSWRTWKEKMVLRNAEMIKDFSDTIARDLMDDATGANSYKIPYEYMKVHGSGIHPPGGGGNTTTVNATINANGIQDPKRFSDALQDELNKAYYGASMPQFNN